MRKCLNGRTAVGFGKLKINIFYNDKLLGGSMEISLFRIGRGEIDTSRVKKGIAEVAERAQGILFDA